MRTLIVEHPKEWNAMKKKVLNRTGFELAGSALKRAPKGFDPEHVLIDDLRRKDYIAMHKLPVSAIHTKDFGKNSRAIDQTERTTDGVHL